MIGCLEGHGAAVNAVQIFGNEVVSASGDRTVKVWNWPEQTCIRTLIGHTKGIACVQYDGRRIVSGSSDNEVKVFDKESGLEVASLRAHSNLVRTVQAGFGDLPYSAEEDREDAKAIDHEYFKAVDSGAVSRTVLLQRGRPRNAGSRKPEDITAYGAKLPPGGGGGRFGRIVSGSYDETIIIWRRDKEGVWRAQHTLRQEEAALAASRAAPDTRRTSERTASQRSQAATLPHHGGSLALDVDAPTAPFAPGSELFYQHLVDVTLPQGPAALRQALQAHPQILNYDYISEMIEEMPSATQEAMNSVVASAFRTQEQLQASPPGSNWQSQSQSQGVASQSHASTSQPPAASAPLATPAITQPASQPITLVAPQPTVLTAAPAAAQAAGHHHHHAPHHHLPANMARVFKLQFDARRIICCSQTSVIVGWDFANGDEQIIEASRFFAPIE